jgi:hypothetical protein
MIMRSVLPVSLPLNSPRASWVGFSLSLLLLIGWLGGGTSARADNPRVAGTESSVKGVPGEPRGARLSRKQNPPPTGQLIAQGPVYLNEVLVLTGATVFNNMLVRVSAEAGSRALVNLGPLGTVELAAGAQLVLRFGGGVITGELLSGEVTINAPAGVRVAISTPDGLVESPGTEPTRLPVRSSKGSSLYEVEGRMTVNPAGTTVTPSVPTASNLAALLLGITGSVAVTAVSVTLAVVSPFTP